MHCPFLASLLPFACEAVPCLLSEIRSVCAANLSVLHITWASCAPIVHIALGQIMVYQAEHAS